MPFVCLKKWHIKKSINKALLCLVYTGRGNACENDDDDDMNEEEKEEKDLIRHEDEEDNEHG